MATLQICLCLHTLQAHNTIMKTSPGEKYSRVDVQSTPAITTLMTSLLDSPRLLPLNTTRWFPSTGPSRGEIPVTSGGWPCSVPVKVKVTLDLPIPPLTVSTITGPLPVVWRAPVVTASLAMYGKEGTWRGRKRERERESESWYICTRIVSLG